jgi:hypothetical protein
MCETSMVVGAANSVNQSVGFALTRLSQTGLPISKHLGSGYLP